MKFRWVTLQVKDMEKSLSFYSGLLGLPIAAEFGTEQQRIIMLGAADEPKVELICQKEGSVENPGQGVSFGLAMDDLEGAIERIRQVARVVGPLSPAPDVHFYFVTDPDGYQVQLLPL